MRIFGAAGLGVFVAISLFYFMSSLIRSSGIAPKSDETTNFIDFVRVKPKSHLDVKQRKTPKSLVPTPGILFPCWTGMCRTDASNVC